MEFSEPDIFNYSTLLLSEKKDALYVGAREAIFELSKKNVSVKNNKVWKENDNKTAGKRFKNIFLVVLIFFFFFPSRCPQVQWTATDEDIKMCSLKGKSKEVNLRFHIICFTPFHFPRLQNLMTRYFCSWCLRPEGLFKLHPGAPGAGRRAALCLRNKRLSAAVWICGRVNVQSVLKAHSRVQRQPLSESMFYAPPAEPGRLLAERPTWRRQGEVLLRPLAELHHRHGWWVEPTFVLFHK